MTFLDLSEFDPAYGKREEFGALARQSGRLLNAHSHAQIAGAENLLRKAVRALAEGNRERSDQLVSRAAMPAYDEREEGSPGVRAAGILVHASITDRFEVAEPDDLAWLDAVLEVHPRLDATGQADVASVVHGLVLQDAVYELTPTERRRIREVFSDAPLEADLGDTPDATVEQRRSIIASLVAATVALESAFAAAGLDRP